MTLRSRESAVVGAAFAAPRTALFSLHCLAPQPSWVRPVVWVPTLADLMSYAPMLAGARGSRKDGYPAYDDGLASGLAFLVRVSALTREQVLAIRAQAAWSGFATAVRSSTLARLVNGDRAATVCERSVGCTGILAGAPGYALLAARDKPQLG